MVDRPGFMASDVRSAIMHPGSYWLKALPYLPKLPPELSEVGLRVYRWSALATGVGAKDFSAAVSSDCLRLEPTVGDVQRAVKVWETCSDQDNDHGVAVELDVSRL